MPILQGLILLLPFLVEILRVIAEAISALQDQLGVSPGI